MAASAEEYEMPNDPEGCSAVIPLSDGVRLILADGSVVSLNLTDVDTDTELTETITGSGGGSIFTNFDDDESPRITVGLPTDHEAAQHPMVREALEDLGFWEPEDGGDD